MSKLWFFRPHSTPHAFSHLLSIYSVFQAHCRHATLCSFGSNGFSRYQLQMLITWCNSFCNFHLETDRLDIPSLTAAICRVWNQFSFARQGTCVCSLDYTFFLTIVLLPEVVVISVALLLATLARQSALILQQVWQLQTVCYHWPTQTSLCYHSVASCTYPSYHCTILVLHNCLHTPCYC